MACEGGECKVQIFDVRAKNVRVVETWRYAGGFPQQKEREPGDKYCKKPTETQIADALRKKPIWLSDCPNPGKEKKAPCHCIFTEDDLDSKRGWTRWVQRKVPNELITIYGTDGPDLEPNSTCRYLLAGTYEESSKILHGACMDSAGLDSPQKERVALSQGNPKEPSE